MARSIPFFNPFVSKFLAFLFLISSISTLETEYKRLPRHGGGALFIFGDSYYDPGNNNYINTSTLDQANFWPYGETFFGFPTGRFSDGRLVSDFIAEFAKLPLIPPFLQPQMMHYSDGVNFASAGAGALVDTYKGYEVHRRGGRKFGFINLGTLGCIPGIRALQKENHSDCFQEASTLAKLHNEALSKKLLDLKDQLKGFKYSLYDFNNTSTQLSNHPTTYGFKEGKIACCGIGRFRGTSSCGGKRPVKEFELCDNPNNYVFWDAYHFTQKAYEFMAHQMWSGASSVVRPFNLSHLYQCL